MSLLPKGTRIVVATHNPGKLTEINDLLRPLGLDAVSAASLGLPEPDETGSTFAANAILKAQASALGANLAALSDDSGLCVDSLDGEPGIYSARWAGPSKDFSVAMQLVEDELQKRGTSNRRAHFICALCLAFPDGKTHVFEGRVDGTLVWPPRGKRGFGYDAMFLPDGESLTFGEMEPDAKHAMSHRARAFKLFLDALT
ncbi:MAG: RdgB/HAM1 family non-canonical purine NTP pyrophosphatase [Aestuariivirgaceae bacterium]|nr:RdgB/HAM1 family non-canonical purine NTP pyrophosphatase [Aestuariivirgaceae bacterium]